MVNQPINIIKIAVSFFTIALVSFNSNAIESKKKDSNIVCFAARDKWVCAPENQQNQAQEKVNQMLNAQELNQKPTTIVIKKIAPPPNFKKTNSLTATTKLPKRIDTISTRENSSSKNNTKFLQQRWAYQLIGLSSPQSAINYVKKHNLNSNNTKIIQSKYKNMDWWVVLYGSYYSKQEGVADKPNLPNTLRNAWLRPLKNLIIIDYVDNY